MATITIPQLDTVAVPTGNDLIEVVQPDSGSASGYSTGKESLSQVANLIANGTQYSGLHTTDQTLVGSINEVAANSGHTYSTTEKVVGTWVNGKPIYEKSFQFSNITVQAGQVYEIQTNTLVPDYENWVGFECVATTYNIVMNCNYYGSFTPYGWSASVADDVIAITRGTAGDVTSDYVITLRYTKTTD